MLVLTKREKILLAVSLFVFFYMKFYFKPILTSIKRYNTELEEINRKDITCNIVKNNITKKINLGNKKYTSIMDLMYQMENKCKVTIKDINFNEIKKDKFTSTVIVNFNVECELYNLKNIINYFYESDYALKVKSFKIGKTSNSYNANFFY
ncbi:hypothetical protein [Thermobrachium celere]|uniref:hypothetical protein n=1 Tax=Thermobrachium celere TaxID=53422 RepID=UPI001940A9EF|nr:hypothetical protein [Thermobrachium celere]GFR36413.1 hypothetical protein TCEA9_22250 [Thermobrachium celere]